MPGRSRRQLPIKGYTAFCLRDETLIGNCLRDLPGIYLRLAHEIAQPSATETHVHVPFGPSVPLRLDVDAAMRLTAARLRAWQARVIAVKRLDTACLAAPILAAESVRDAAAALGKHLSVLLALKPDYMTANVPLRPGRHGQPATISDDAVAEHGDAEIVRMGADFMGLWVKRDGAAAGLEVLHLHYWCRAVLRETRTRPEELLGVECRACSLLALRRADPPWFDGDPEYWAECAS